MSIILAILAYWFLLSCVTAACLCWLLKTKRISFEPIVDRSEFDRGWGPRK